MMRKRLFEELDAVAKGAEPKGTVRNANVAKCVELPNITKKTSTEGITLAEFPNYPLLNARLKGFRHCFGQPPEVRKAFCRRDGDRAVVRSGLSAAGTLGCHSGARAKPASPESITPVCAIMYYVYILASANTARSTSASRATSCDAFMSTGTIWFRLHLPIPRASSCLV